MMKRTGIDNHELPCPFCDIHSLQIILENHSAAAFYDKYPVQRGHLLIILKRHAATYFDATDEEIIAIHELIRKGKELLDREYSPDVRLLRSGGTSFHPKAYLFQYEDYDGVLMVGSSICPIQRSLTESNGIWPCRHT